MCTRAWASATAALVATVLIFQPSILKAQSANVGRIFGTIMQNAIRAEQQRRLLKEQQRAEDEADFKARRQVQLWLMLLGDYPGPLDGEFGAGTIAAIKRFQEMLQVPATGALGPAEFHALANQAQTRAQQLGLKYVLDPDTGIGIVVPETLLSKRITNARGTEYVSPDGLSKFGLRRVTTTIPLRAVYNKLKLDAADTNITYDSFRGDWFVLAGVAIQNYYVRVFAEPGGIACFFAVTAKSLKSKYKIPLAVSSLTLRPFAGFPDATISQLHDTSVLSDAIADSKIDVEAIAKMQEQKRQAEADRQARVDLEKDIVKKRDEIQAQIKASLILDSAKRTEIAAVLARLAVVSESNSIKQLRTLDQSADDTLKLFAQLREFERVCDIANQRSKKIELRLKSVVSDAPYVAHLDQAIAAVQESCKSDSTEQVQYALAVLKKVYDENRANIERDSFVSP